MEEDRRRISQPNIQQHRGGASIRRRVTVIHKKKHRDGSVSVEKKKFYNLSVKDAITQANISKSPEKNGKSDYHFTEPLLQSPVPSPDKSAPQNPTEQNKPIGTDYSDNLLAGATADIAASRNQDFNQLRFESNSVNVNKSNDFDLSNDVDHYRLHIQKNQQSDNKGSRVSARLSVKNENADTGKAPSSNNRKKIIIVKK